MDIMDFEDIYKRKIRLPEKRWNHIVERHPELAGSISMIKATIANPDLVQEGSRHELLAIKKFKKTPITENKYCIVVYKLEQVDGFIITAYFTRRPSIRRKLLWKK